MRRDPEGSGEYEEAAVVWTYRRYDEAGDAVEVGGDILPVVSEALPDRVARGDHVVGGDA